VPLLAALYEQRLQAPGPQHRDTREVYLDLYDMLVAAEQQEAAVQLAERHLAAVRSKVGDKDRQTLLALNKLAGAYSSRKQPTKAIPLFEQAVRLSVELYGPDDADTLLVRRNLSGAYRADKRPDDAARTLEEGVKEVEMKLGKDHPTTLKAVFDLGAHYQQARRYNDAATAFRRVLDTRSRVLGRDHVETLQAMYRLAQAQLLRGELTEAEQLLGECQKRLVALQQPPEQLGKQVEAAQKTLELRKKQAAAGDKAEQP
jgi:tetratricopeptide (TPR) repeat protein